MPDANGKWLPDKTWKKLRQVKCPNCLGHNISMWMDVRMFRCKDCSHEFD